jgi:5'-deoxynucleotidase YfbR-like HD superfamily hydrolase
MAFLGGLFGKRKRTIDNVAIDELTMAKVKLEQEQERVMRRVSELEKQKETLFQQGVSDSSKRRQLLLAQKIQEIELQAKNYDRNLAAYSKQLRVINGVVFLKENRRSWEDTPLGQIMGNMDLGELENFVDQATANNVFQMDKFERLLGSMEESEALSGGEDMDEGVAQIMAEMERARASSFAGAGLEKLGQALAAEPSETDKR